MTATATPSAATTSTVSVDDTAALDPSHTRRTAHHPPVALFDPGPDTDGEPADRVRAAVLRLLERFQADVAAGLTASFAIHLKGHEARTITVHDGRCTVSSGADAAADATLATDANTWLALVDGHVDGVTAFLDGRLHVDGDLALATQFQTLFAPGPHAVRAQRSTRTPTRGAVVDALVAGSGRPVVLLHGLGASKVSFLPTVATLADHYEVHALDLPGFGRSSRPLPTGRRYSMPWFADVINGYLIDNQLGDVHVIGNSMGGRIGLELALRHPRSVRSLTALGAAVGFDRYRRLAPLLRLSQPQWLGLAPVPLPAARIEEVVRGLFHDPSGLPDRNHTAAAQDVARDWSDPAYRLALLACARTLGAERSRGRRAYWNRLGRLTSPSYWIFGRQDRLVPHSYADRVRTAAPDAQVEVWDGIGHVPQFEDPDRVGAALHPWLAGVDATR